MQKVKEMQNQKQVRPCKPIAPYIGGKSQLAEKVVGYINTVPHKTYLEVFMGMGGIFLRRNYQPDAEVINDYSNDISNFYRILQCHYVAFMDMLKWQITTRSEFDRLCKTDPNTLTDLQRAARFLYLQRIAYGGKVSGRSFGVSKDRPGRFDVTKLATMLEDLHERISGVIIENLDYKELISKYDYPEALFYLDPPYYESESDYGKELFSRDEFPLMADLLGNIEGHFILSLNDHEAVRDIFSDFYMIGVETTYSLATESSKKVKEVIITNAKEHLDKSDLFGV